VRTLPNWLSRAFKWLLISAGLALAWLLLAVLRIVLTKSFGEHPQAWQRAVIEIFRPLTILVALDLALIVKRRISIGKLPFYAQRLITYRTYVSLWFFALFPLAVIAYGYARWTLPVVSAIVLADILLIVRSKPQGLKRLAHFGCAAAMTFVITAFGFLPSILVTQRTFRKQAPLERCVAVESENRLKPVFYNYRHLNNLQSDESSLAACIGGEIFDPYRIIYDKPSNALFMSFEWLRKVARLDLDDPYKCSSFWVQNQSAYPALNHSRQEVYACAWNLSEWFILDAETLELKHTIAFPSEGPWATSGAKILVYDPVGDAVIFSNESAELVRYSFESQEYTHRVTHTLGTIHMEVSFLLFPEKRIGILANGFDRRWPFVGTIRKIDLDDLSLIRSRGMYDVILEALDVPELGGILISLPMTGRIKLLDADTLETLDTYRFSQGVRSLAFDEKRQLLFGGNYLTGKVEVYSIPQDRIVDEIFAGLLIRSLALIPGNDELYIGSECGIFILDLSQYDQLAQ